MYTNYPYYICYVVMSVLRVLQLNGLSAACLKCPSLSGDSPNVREHTMFIDVMLMHLHAYLQTTGGVYIVKRAVRATMKNSNSKTLSLVNGSSSSSSCSTSDGSIGIKGSDACMSVISNSDSNCSLANRATNGVNTRSSETNLFNSNLEYYDLFGNMFSKDYLSEHYKRFSGDRKILLNLQSRMSKLSKACNHIKSLSLLMALLYMR